jgi:hypothetical protein
VGDVPRVVASALLRPHPLEAHNAVTLAAAAETTALAALAIAVAPELPRTLAQLRRRPYVAFSAVAAGVLALLMGQLANFGALVRQRTPALPFLLVLLAAAPRRNRG